MDLVGGCGLREIILIHNKRRQQKDLYNIDMHCKKTLSHVMYNL